MIYSYKEIVHLDPPVYTESFNTSHVIEQERTKLEKQLESAQESERPKIQEKLFNVHNICTVLGKVDDRYYISVPDDCEIGEQIQACDVKSELVLDERVRQALLNSGYAADQRRLASLNQVVLKSDPSMSWAHMQNFANLYSELRAISSVVADIAAASPATMEERSLDVGVPSYGLSLIQKYKTDDDELTNDLLQLGL